MTIKESGLGIWTGKTGHMVYSWAVMDKNDRTLAASSARSRRQALKDARNKRREIVARMTEERTTR